MPDSVEQTQIFTDRCRSGVFTSGCSGRVTRSHRRQGRDTDSEQAKLAIQWHPLETVAGGTEDCLRFTNRAGIGFIARDRAKVLITQFDTDGLSPAAFADQILAEAFAQGNQNPSQRLAIKARIEIALERDLAADGLRFADGDDGALVTAVCRFAEPAP